MQTPDLERNKAVVLRYIDEIQNGHDIGAFENIFTEDFIDHTASGGGIFQGGIDGLKQGYEMFLNAFPDLRSTVNLLVAEADKVVAYKTLTGTHRDSFLGVPATDMQVEFKIISIYGIRDGKIAEFWGLQDELSLMRQLGGET